MSDDGVPRKLLGTKKEEVTDWRILHNEELHIVYPISVAYPGILFGGGNKFY